MYLSQLTKYKYRHLINGMNEVGEEKRKNTNGSDTSSPGGGGNALLGPHKVDRIRP